MHRVLGTAHIGSRHTELRGGHAGLAQPNQCSRQERRGETTPTPGPANVDGIGPATPVAIGDVLLGMDHSVDRTGDLFPIEGDPMAASAFWKLALATRGSFMSPAKDWP